MVGELFPAHGLTGLGAADLDDVAARRRAAEVGVEGDDAVDFGAGQVQGLGDGLHRLGRNTAQLVLDRVQHRQQRAGLVLEAGDDAGRGGHGWRLRAASSACWRRGAAGGRKIGFCLAGAHGGLLLMTDYGLP